MRATVVELAGNRATVRLTPGWLFGAREMVAELHVAEVPRGYPDLSGAKERERWDDGSLRWRFAATGRSVRDMQHGELILRALERVPMAAPTRAIARRR